MPSWYRVCVGYCDATQCFEGKRTQSGARLRRPDGCRRCGRVQFPGRPIWTASTRRHGLDQQSARHHQQAGCRTALSGRCFGRSARRQPYAVGQPLQPRAGFVSAAAAARCPGAAGSGACACRKPGPRRIGAGLGASGSPRRQDDDRHRRSRGIAVQGRAARRASSGAPPVPRMPPRSSSGMAKRLAAWRTATRCPPMSS